jgi:hypothetical protein
LLLSTLQALNAIVNINNIALSFFILNHL